MESLIRISTVIALANITILTAMLIIYARHIAELAGLSVLFRVTLL
jgi:hypothetical protein